MQSRLALVAALTALAVAAVWLGAGTQHLGGLPEPSPLVRSLAAAALVLSVAAAAAAAWADRPGPAWALTALTASWVAGAVVAQPGPPPAPAVVMSLGAAPLVVQIAVAHPAAWPSRRIGRQLVSATWLAVAGAGAVRLLVYDPFADAGCVIDCTAGSVLVHADTSLARALGTVAQVATVFGGLATVAIAARRFVAGAVGGLLLAAGAVTTLAAGSEPSAAARSAAFVLAASATVAVSAGAFLAAVVRLRGRARLGRLVAQFGDVPVPGMLASKLARALGDPGLRIVYASGDGAYLTADGSPAAVAPLQAATRLVRADQEIAVVVHDPAAVDPEELRQSLGPAFRLAVANERLRAEQLARLDQLRASRARIVERADRERLRLERDLHDSAQQRLLMLAYELRTAAVSDPAIAGSATPVAEDVDRALAELRDIAHGVYPGALDSGGLSSALDVLANGPVAIAVLRLPGDRLSVPVERAAYRVVSDAVDAARATGAGPISVDASLADGSLVLTVGGAAGLELTALADRLGALGGSIRRNGTGITCEVPCA